MAPSFLVMTDAGCDGGDASSIGRSGCIITTTSGTLGTLPGSALIGGVGTVVPEDLAPVVRFALVLDGRPTVAASPRWWIFCDVTTAAAALVAIFIATATTTTTTTTSTAILASSAGDLHPSTAGGLTAPTATAPSTTTLASRLKGVNTRVKGNEISVSLRGAPCALLEQRTVLRLHRRSETGDGALTSLLELGRLDIDELAELIVRHLLVRLEQVEVKVGHGPAERKKHVLEPVDLGVEVVNLEVELDEDGREHEEPLARLVYRGLGLCVRDLDQDEEAAGGAIHDESIIVGERVLRVLKDQALADLGGERLGHGRVQHFADLCLSILSWRCCRVDVDAAGKCLGLDLGQLAIGVPIQQIYLHLGTVGIGDGGVENANAIKELGPALERLDERSEVGYQHSVLRPGRHPQDVLQR